MTMAETAMHPEQALQTIAELRDHREALTRRAAGMVWMVWGLCLAGIALMDLAAVMGGPDAKWDNVDLLAIIVFGAAGALMTNAIHRAQAIPAQASWWAPWAAAAVVLGAVAAIGWTINHPLARNVPDLGHPQAVLAFLYAAGAMALAVLQRHRAPVLPGIVLAFLLLAAFAVAFAISYERTPARLLWGGLAMALLPLSYFAVGWAHFLRG